MSNADPRSTKRRVQERRRLAFGAGLGMMLASATGAIAIGTFGSGCIFDQGGYDGGGRRGTVPSASDSEETDDTPPPTTTTTTTSPASPDSGSQLPDTGSPDV